jgi:tetratricopeptide (TPR) repeat protein
VVLEGTAAMPPHDLTLHREIPRAVPTMIGRRIGRYRVLASLGRGGMSSVWRAHDELLDRDVALKLLGDELASSPRARRRFRHEARVAASLDHPAVAAVYDSGEADGVTFIAMALIEGETVAERLERSLMPIDEALQVTSAVAGALAHAHARGVVHRDVTSRNVMLARDGRVLVLDFGLALAAGVSRVSSSRTIVGTAAYMAPEVLQGRDADARSDLYGLGVVLHEMLTGRLPFEGERREAITYAALNQEPVPPSRWRAEVTPELDRVVMRLLARAPEERFAGAEALLADLGALPVETVKASPAGPAPVAAGGSSSGTRSVAAELVASGRGPLYVVLVPFDVEADPGAGPAAMRLASDLVKTLSASITHLGKVHLVTAEPPIPGEDAGVYTRRVGAHAQLGGAMRLESATARVTWRLVDADRGAQIAAGSVRGAAADVAGLEDELVADVRRGLGLEAERGGFDSRAVTQVPAAAERYQQALRYLVRFDHEASVDGAIGILQRLTSAAPQDGVLHATLARAYLAKFMLTRQHALVGQASAAVERAMRMAPEEAETLVALGELRLHTGQNGDALQAFGRAVEARPGMLEAQLGVVRALEALGRSVEAEAACMPIVADHADDWRSHHEMGLVLFRRGEFARAAEAWRKAMSATPDNAWVARNLGSAYFRSDRFEDAIEVYRRSLELQPNPIAYTNLGTALFYEGRHEEAIAAFEKAADLSPADPVMWGNLGDAIRLAGGEPVRVREVFQRAVGLMRESLARNPGDADGWRRLAGWLIGLERIDEAVPASERSLCLAPDDGAVLASAAHVFLLSGDRERALDTLELAVRHGYGADALRRSPELATLKGDPRFERILGARPGASGLGS